MSVLRTLSVVHFSVAVTPVGNYFFFFKYCRNICIHPTILYIHTHSLQHQELNKLKIWYENKKNPFSTTQAVYFKTRSWGNSKYVRSLLDSSCFYKNKAVINFLRCGDSTPPPYPQAGAAPQTLYFYSAIKCLFVWFEPLCWQKLYFLVKILPPFWGSNLGGNHGLTKITKTTPTTSDQFLWKFLFRVSSLYEEQSAFVGKQYLNQDFTRLEFCAHKQNAIIY